MVGAVATEREGSLGKCGSSDSPMRGGMARCPATPCMLLVVHACAAVQGGVEELAKGTTDGEVTSDLASGSMVQTREAEVWCGAAALACMRWPKAQQRFLRGRRRGGMDMRPRCCSGA